MNIVIEFPPNIDNIREVFTISGKEMFAWGDTIYNPSGNTLTKELLAHERVHCQQQGRDIQGWWDKYLINLDFRFKQELKAHQVEYAVNKQIEIDRNRRRIYLREISKRLSSPLYGNMVTFDKAKKLIKAGPIETT